MQRFVLSDPGMKPVADAVVWSSVETEREPNKPVVEKYPVDAWPTFLIVDPDTEGVLGRFLGSGTVQDMRAFVQDGVRAYREKGKPADPAWAAQREGDAARARGDLKSTAEAYGRAVQLGRADDPQRPQRRGQVDGGGDVAGVGDVGGRVGGGLAQLLGQGLALGGVTVEDDDLGPGADQAPDGGLPEPRGPSGDDGGSPRNLHGRGH